jgi:hypothetical protein
VAISSKISVIVRSGIRHATFTFVSVCRESLLRGVGIRHNENGLQERLYAHNTV